MKKVFSLLVAATLLFSLSVPAFAEETGDGYTVERTEIQGVGFDSIFDIGFLLGSPGDSLSLADLWGLFFGGYASASPLEPSTQNPGLPNHPATGGDGYTPEPYKPYEIRKTKTYYDKKGNLEYELILTAVFIDLSSGTYCLRAESSYFENDGSWKIIPEEPKRNGDSVRADFSVSLLFTGVPVKTETVTLSLTASDRNTTSAVGGDVDGDGIVTAADARLTLRFAVNLQTPSSHQKSTADMDGDGIVTAADARLILRKAVGL